MINELKNFLILIAIKSLFWLVGIYTLIFGITLLFTKIYSIPFSIFIVFIGASILILGNTIELD